MQFKRILSTFLGALTAVGCIAATASGAQASKLVSGVAFPGGSTKGSSVFLSSDPVYGPGYSYPTYLINTLKTGKVGSGYNLPTINNGNDILPNVGKFREFALYYDVPNLGPAADSGLQVVIQTADGFSRIASPISNLYNSDNGFYTYQIDLLPGDFSPAFSPDQVVLRTASVRYTGSIGPIYMFYPVVVGKNSTLENFDFNFKTTPDSQFNNGN
ncbi:MAG: hypothetical protein JST89_21715 [Cyanobacteria bacterium SZAS-4]|nr:hypothetical protein [Cyanobacteria bacterium SZAS-4]